MSIPTSKWINPPDFLTKDPAVKSEHTKMLCGLIPTELNDKLEAFAKKTKITKTKILTLCLEAYIDHEEQQFNKFSAQQEDIWNQIYTATDPQLKKDLRTALEVLEFEFTSRYFK